MAHDGANNSLMRRFFLLIAGASAGVLGGLLVRDLSSPPLKVAVACLFAVFSLVGFGIPKLIREVCSRRWRHVRRRAVVRLGILFDLGRDKMDGSNSTWAELSAQNWYDKSRLIAGKRPRLRPRLIRSTSYLGRFHVILNPYGGVFPEENTATLPTLERIFTYAANGGLVINVADLPAYYVFDSKLGTRVDATPLVFTSDMSAGRPFALTPLLQRLALKAQNFESCDTTNWTCFGCSKLDVPDTVASALKPTRTVLIEKNVIPIITLQPPDSNVAFTPLFSVPFGKGGFLFSFYWFGEKYPQNRPVSDLLLDLSKKRSILFVRDSIRKL